MSSSEVDPIPMCAMDEFCISLADLCFFRDLPFVVPYRDVYVPVRRLGVV
jgi:hypothetical protein